MLNAYDSFDEFHGIYDIEPPLNAELSAIYKRSFAYQTFRVRVHHIIKNIIKTLERDTEELVCQYGSDAKWDSKRVIRALSRLIERINNNQEFEIFYGTEPDKECWNNLLASLPDEKRTWFSSYWLYAETYLYRRISYFFKRTVSLSDYDCFGKEKQIALFYNAKTMLAVAKVTRNLPLEKEHFVKLLKLQLWGNRSDLSITKDRFGPEVYRQIDDYDNDLLCDEAESVWDDLITVDKSRPVIVDIICDNAGFEMFTDFLMAEYIIDHELAGQVRFHVKAIPWYVSDVTHNDYKNTLLFLRREKSPVMHKLGKKWMRYTAEEKFLLERQQYFWTSPFEYYKMNKIRPCLYVKLSDAALVIVKGDLNYRKLVGDIACDPLEPFAKRLKAFRPTSVCALRTLKSDVVCGLQEGIVDNLTNKYYGKKWMFTGQFGIIQFAKHLFKKY